MFADNFGPEYNQSSQLNCEHLGPLAASCNMVSAFKQASSLRGYVASGRT